MREYNRNKARIPDRILVDKLSGLEDKVSGDKDGKNNLWLWTCIILVVILILITIIILVVLSVTGVSSALTLGPGDNTPCLNYTALSDYWRMLGRRPLAPGVGYNCDIFLTVIITHFNMSPS